MSGLPWFVGVLVSTALIGGSGTAAVRRWGR